MRAITDHTILASPIVPLLFTTVNRILLEDFKFLQLGIIVLVVMNMLTLSLNSTPSKLLFLILVDHTVYTKLPRSRTLLPLMCRATEITDCHACVTTAAIGGSDTGMHFIGILNPFPDQFYFIVSTVHASSIPIYPKQYVFPVSVHKPLPFSTRTLWLIHSFHQPALVRPLLI